MKTCSITKMLKIVPGTRADYDSLAHYHYREHNLRPYVRIFALKGNFRTAEKLQTAGVIVYSMPTAGAQLRNIATAGLFTGLDRQSRLKLVNKNIRTISRVIIEPRFRALGLAARLVKETMPVMDVPFIEALAVMGRINPFFEKAGMTRYEPPISTDCARLTEALDTVGITEQQLIDPQLVQRKIDKLAKPARRFIEREMKIFVQAYGKRRLMKPGIERTRFVLTKLTERPVYYFWKNPNLQLIIDD